jgi:hypothetical protein
MSPCLTLPAARRRLVVKAARARKKRRVQITWSYAEYLPSAGILKTWVSASEADN